MNDIIERLRTHISLGYTADVASRLADLDKLESAIADLTEQGRVRDEAMRILAEKYIGAYYPKSNPFYASKVERLIHDALDAAKEK